MADEFSTFNKLSQLIPTGKAKDYTEMIVGKEVPHRRKRKKNEPVLKQEKGQEKKSQGNEHLNGQPAGSVLDILV